MVRVVPHVAAAVRRFAHGIDRGGHNGADGAPEATGMSVPTKLWLYLCAVILWSSGWWCGGYHTADAAWTQRDTDRKLASAEAAKKLSEEYRIKEQQKNEYIGTIETKAINDAASAEMAYRDVIDRLRNAGAHPTNGLRVKPALTCRAVPNSSSTSSNGNEEIQAGLSPEVAERVIGIGAECDQVVVALDACQAYIESIRTDLTKRKAP